LINVAHCLKNEKPSIPMTPK